MRACFSCVSGQGHVDPLLPLARALRAAGHDVVFATAASFAERLGADGFRVLPAGLEHDQRTARLAPYLGEIVRLPVTRRRPLVFTRVFACVDAPAKADELLAAASAWQPDLIVHDAADLAGPVVAAVLDLPSVSHGYGPLVPLPILEDAAQLVAPLWQRFGLAPEPLCGLARSLYVDVCPPSLQRETLPGVRTQTLRSVSVDGAVSRPCGERPRIYATLGTAFNEPDVMRVLLAGLGGGEWDVLATVGADTDPAVVGPQPAGVRVARYVPQSHVLPACDLVVCHGGSGTMLGALAHGLPLLLVPQGADHFDNGERCLQAGVALQLLPHELTAQAVREHARTLLTDDNYARSAQRIAGEIAAMPPPERLVPGLEALAQKRSVPGAFE